MGHNSIIDLKDVPCEEVDMGETYAYHFPLINFHIQKDRDVYIKIRVEPLGLYGNTTTFVMSFHFAERAFTPEMFPYKKK